MIAVRGLGRRSVAWKNAATQLARIAKQSLDLARALGESDILAIAESAAARVCLTALGASRYKKHPHCFVQILLR